MNYQTVFRYTILVISALAMATGILITIGVLPISFPDQYRALMGIVIFLYGGYRFAIAYFRRTS